MAVLDRERPHATRHDRPSVRPGTKVGTWTRISEGEANTANIPHGAERLTEAFSIIEDSTEIDVVVEKLRDLLTVDHVVYHSSNFGASPSVDPYIRLTYPASWIKRYLQMGYIYIDPVVREGFQRVLPFSWNELTIQNAAEVSFLTDALSHGVGPYGFSIPVLSKRGHRALFSISSSRSEQEWNDFLAANRAAIIEIANRLHCRVVVEVFA